MLNILYQFDSYFIYEYINIKVVFSSGVGGVWSLCWAALWQLIKMIEDIMIWWPRGINMWEGGDTMRERMQCWKISPHSKKQDSVNTHLSSEAETKTAITLLQCYWLLFYRL